MKRMKRISFVILTILTVVLCSSCKKHGVADDLVQYLNEHDEEGIMGLFSDSVGSSPHIDFVQQISDVFDLLGDRTITSYFWRGGASRAHYEKGEKTWESGSIFIEELEFSDESDDIVRIVFHETTADVENPRNVGFKWIEIITDDEQEYWIGESD